MKRENRIWVIKFHPNPNKNILSAVIKFCLLKPSIVINIKKKKTSFRYNELIKKNINKNQGAEYMKGAEKPLTRSVSQNLSK